MNWTINFRPLLLSLTTLKLPCWLLSLLFFFITNNFYDNSETLICGSGIIPFFSLPHKFRLKQLIAVFLENIPQKLKGEIKALFFVISVKTSAFYPFFMKALSLMTFSLAFIIGLAIPWNFSLIPFLFTFTSSCSVFLGDYKKLNFTFFLSFDIESRFFTYFIFTISFSSQSEMSSSCKIP